MTKNFFSICEVAELISVEVHVINYALKTRKIPEPSQKCLGKRLFSEQDIENIKTYFKNRKGKSK